MVPDQVPETAGELLLAAANHWPERLGLIIGSHERNHAQLWREGVDCARALWFRGVRRGDRVGIFLPNCAEYLTLLNGLALIGAAGVTLNARLRADDLGYAVRKAQLKLLFTCNRGGHFDGLTRVSASFPDKDGPSVVDVEYQWGAFLVSGDDIAEAAIGAAMAEVVPEDDWLIMFSSGTTASPKACRLSHRAVLLSSAGMAERFQIGPEDRFWNPLPFFHMSTILPMTACRLRGAAFIGVEHFDAASALTEIADLNVTIAYPAFPTLMAAMIADPSFERTDLSRVRATLAVGPADLLRRFQSAWPQAVQLSCYGLTEAGGLSCYNTPDDPLEARLTTGGRPIDGMQARIVDPEGGEILPAGSVGAIQLRGPTLFSGYFDDLEHSRAALTADGWLHTGDLGRIDTEGRVAYVGRFKDMLRIGGENVAAAEIESFLMTHPAIKLAQVIGVPDDALGEVAAAFVELTPGKRITEAEVARYCHGRIASYKVPRYARIVADWPMSATKIQKFRLSESFVAERRIG